MISKEQIEVELENEQEHHHKSVLDSDRIFPLLMKLSLPTIIGGLMSALYNTIDSIFVGHYIGGVGLAALTISNTIQIVLIAFAAMCSQGTGTLISQLLGAKKFEEVNKTLSTGVIGVFIITAMLSIIMLIFLDPILLFIGANSETLLYTKNYIQIILYAGFIIPLNAVLAGALRANGQARLAMILSVSGALLNILLDFIFIVVVRWGVSGVALATMLSQAFVTFLSFYYTKQVYKTPFRYFNFSKINYPQLARIFTVGAPSGLRMGMLALTTLIANQVLQGFGVAALAAFGIVNRIISLAFMPIQGCNFGVQPIISYNFGAKRIDRIAKALQSSIILVSIIGILGTILFMWAPTGLFALFSKNHEIIVLTQQASRYMGSLFFFFGAYMVLSGFTQSVGHVKEALFLAFSRPLINAILYLIVPKYFGLIGIWLVSPFSDLINTTMAIILAIIVYHKVKYQITQ